MTYQVQKFVRRNRLLVGSVASVFAALLLGLLVSIGLGRELYAANETSKENEKTARNAEEDAKATALELEKQLYAANVAQASNALNESNQVVALDCLSRCPEHLRDWEWNRLKTLATTRSVAVLKNTRNPEFLPDGTLVTLGIGKRDGEVCLWNRSTFDSVREVSLGLEDLTGLAIHPAGESVAVVSRAGTVASFNLSDQKQTWSTSIDGDIWTSALSYSEDGGQLFAIANGIHRWNTQTGDDHLFHRSEGATGRESAISDGQLLVTSHEYDPFPLWKYDSASLKKLGEFSNFGSAIHAIALSPDRKRMACGGADGRVTIRSFPDCKVEHFIGPHNDKVYSVCFSTDGNSLATSATGLVVVWDAKTGEEKNRILNDYSHIYSVRYSPDSRFLAIAGERYGGADATTVYDLSLLGDAPCASDTLVSRSESYDWWSADFSPSGRLVATTGADQAVDIWDADARELKHRLYSDVGHAAGIGWSHDEKTIYVSFGNGELRAIDFGTGKVHWKKEVSKFEGDPPFDVILSPDGETLYVGTSDKVVLVVNSKDGTLEHRLPGGASLDLSPDGKLLAVSYDATWKTPLIYDLDSLQEMTKLTGHEGHIRCVRFSPDGSLLASTSLDRTVRIWDVETGACKHVLEGHLNGVWSCEFSKSGKRLFSADGLGRLVVWDVDTGNEAYRTEDYSCPFFDLSPDGSTLAVAGKEFCFIGSEPLTEEEVQRRKTVRLAREATKSATRKSLWVADKVTFVRENKELSDEVREAAIAHLQVVGDDPSEFYKWSWNTLLNGSESDWQKAGDYMEIAVEIVPGWAEYRLAAGLAQYRLAQFDKAEQHLRRANELNPQETLDHYDYPVDLKSANFAILAMLKHKTGHSSEAAEYLQRAVELEKPVPDSLTRLNLSKLIREAEELLKTESAN